MAKYLNDTGLSHFMTKIKTWAAATFAPTSHTHTASEAPGSVTGVKGNAESSYRTGNVNITAANVGAVAKSGDTMTGKLTLKAGQYTDDYTTGALDLQNSNIQGVNSIYTGDASEDAAEGIHFYRDSTHVDSIHAKSGQLYFTPNRVLGSAGTSEKVLRETSALKESLLTWGGKNFSASYGPIDAAMIGELGANRLAFSKAEGIAIEYSRDGGTTWTDYGLSDTAKVDLFAKGCTYNIGRYASSDLGQVTTDWKLRVTLTTNLSGTYTVLNKFAFYVSTNGASRSYVTITARTKANLDAGNDTWTTFAEDQRIAGWSGWNIVNTNGLTTYGNTSSQYANVRFEFGITGTLSTTYSNALSVIRIMGFGGVGWSVPSYMAANGHLYNYDANQNATFPGSIYPSTNNSKILGASSLKWASVYAVTYYGNLTGNVTGNVTGAHYGNTTVTDSRSTTLAPSTIDQAFRPYFTNVDMPDSNWWSLFHIKGWTGGYSAWELAGPSHNTDQRTVPLYVRVGDATRGWGSWRKIFDDAQTVPIANGGTGQTTAAEAWTALGGGAIGKKASLVASDIPSHASTATTYGAGSSSNYGHLKLSDATNSSSDTTAGIAATPKAVKAAYDLASSASTTAGQALSAATGALAFKVTYSVSGSDVVCAAHVYSAGSEITSSHADSCFVWSMSLDGGASWTSLGTGKTKTVSAMSTYGGNVKCDFTPAS